MKNPLSLALMYEILRFTQNDSVARCPNGRDMPLTGRDMPLTGRDMPCGAICPLTGRGKA